MELIVEVKKLFDEVVSKFGELNIAINNVGKLLKKSIIETIEEEYDEMFAINSKAAFFFIKQAALYINPHYQGKIVTMVTSLLAAFTGL